MPPHRGTIADALRDPDERDAEPPPLSEGRAGPFLQPTPAPLPSTGKHMTRPQRTKKKNAAGEHEANKNKK